MAEKLVQIRIDEKIKTDADAVLSRRGITMTAAVRMMLYHIATTKTTPFDDTFKPKN